MYVSHLSLLDFRSYETVDVELEPGPNAFVGRNGRGKTNLVEAVGYVATLGSHRVPNDTPLIRAGAQRAVVRTRVVRGDRASTVELEITAGKANRARINRGQLGRARDVLGILRTVLFAPEDLALVKGDPEGRRRFLDQLVVQLLPRAAGVLADYERVLRQRSALLKSLRGHRAGGRDVDTSTLEVWDGRLAQLGGQVLAWRTALVRALGPLVATAYEQVSDADSAAELVYRSTVVAGDGAPVPADELEKLMLAAIEERRAAEIDRGQSLVGPHRDDLELTLGGLPAKGYASHGESWSFALALRLASFRLLGGGEPSAPDDVFWDPDHGSDADPVLILDDVFAELDVRRRERLAELVVEARQVLVTAAVPGDVPERLLGARFEVAEGRVERV
ncbi:MULTISPECIES: DNA replication/repair protein RecF [unclassified Isoptericola]|uniref:DNA replication/repair protein RecF n=1 Tax=unclassified Isoptericola TaxID=2623355 RepID=UPI002712B420|nr:MULTISPECIES: DNA replication/repair protein RecF [unclassified Isoptericola]MDO8143753.1 DNA replication/repair protein RecF [Isoptericola sp. 178]MDO8147654.1 DNA replication/repair protein RecF [Isoptericola sp. b515]MDO8150046.1 DNA replication/repair protein RecF [Isoptericola sp. b408]